MIQRERIADKVYTFQSDIYAQVNAGAVISQDWAVVIDTLALPEETLAIRDFIEQELSMPIRYVINTHSHADHAWGNFFFPGATVIGHSLCREFLDTIGRKSLNEVRIDNPSFRNLKIVLPQVTFNEGELNLRIGKKNLRMFSLPGHSTDNIAVLIEEDRILFAGDAIMTLPYIVDGDMEVLIESMKTVSKMGLENIVAGHGDIVLRGEVESFVKENLAYLSSIRKVVRKASRRKYPQEVLDEYSVEDCGKSRVLMGGLAAELHRRNMRALFLQMYGVLPGSPEEDDYYDDY
jgi:glyoxylase-like metal-dependent hydrolase (beta-lactamase superfamily II)